MSVSVTMQQERRLSKRKTLEQLVYIELASAKDGIVRNISEGGLGFRTVALMEPSGPLPFRFSATFSSGNSKRIEGTGELVWTDEAKKTGGLRFTQLSVGVREQIRSWPNESNRLLGNCKDSARDVPALHESLPAFTETSTDRSPTSEASPHPEVLGPETSAYALQSPEKPYFEEQSRRRLKAICISVLGVIIAVLAYIYREGGEVQYTYQMPPASNLSSEGAPLGGAAADKPKTEGTAAQAAPQLPSTATKGTAKANVAKPPAPGTSAGVAKLRNPLLPHGALIVQVAAFAHEANALKLAERLRQENFPAFVSIASTEGVFYRVQVGPYLEEESARITQNELGRAGFKPFIRH